MTALARWLPLIVALSWCGIHLAISLKIKLRSERHIFIHHALSFAAFAVVLIAWVIVGPISLAVAQGALFLHGIYSLSFLELWSLSQGSYSLGILDSIGRSGHSDQATLVTRMAQIGTDKKTDRISSLSRIGLVNVDNQQAFLSARGRVAAAAIGAMRSLAGTRNVG
jgi:hypothetical protein